MTGYILSPHWSLLGPIQTHSKYSISFHLSKENEPYLQNPNHDSHWKGSSLKWLWKLAFWVSVDRLGGQSSKIQNPQLTFISASSPNNNCKIEFFQSLEEFSSWNEIDRLYFESPWFAFGAHWSKFNVLHLLSFELENWAIHFKLWVWQALAGFHPNESWTACISSPCHSLPKPLRRNSKYSIQFHLA